MLLTQCGSNRYGRMAESNDSFMPTLEGTSNERANYDDFCPNNASKRHWHSSENEAFLSPAMPLSIAKDTGASRKPISILNSNGF